MTRISPWKSIPLSNISRTEQLFHIVNPFNEKRIEQSFPHYSHILLKNQAKSGQKRYIFQKFPHLDSLPPIFPHHAQFFHIDIISHYRELSNLLKFFHFFTIPTFIYLYFMILF